MTDTNHTRVESHPMIARTPTAAEADRRSKTCNTITAAALACAAAAVWPLASQPVTLAATLAAALAAMAAATAWAAAPLTATPQPTPDDTLDLAAAVGVTARHASDTPTAIIPRVQP